MKIKKVIFALIIFLGLLTVSCGDSGLSSSEPINIKQGMGIFFLTQNLPEKYIMDIVKNDEFETFFYFSITQSNVKTGDLPPLENLAYAIAYLDYPSKLKYIKFDEIEMENLTPLVFPTKYEMPVNWNRFKYQFGKRYLWELAMQGEDVYKDTIKTVSEIQKFYINIKDTIISLNTPINLRWTKPSEPTHLWLSMVYNGVGADSLKKISGFKIDDSGSYTINPGDLQKLGVKPIGRITFNLYRFTKKLSNYGDGKRRALFITAGQSSVYIHLKD